MAILGTAATYLDLDPPEVITLIRTIPNDVKMSD